MVKFVERSAVIVFVLLVLAPAMAQVEIFAPVPRITEIGDSPGSGVSIMEMETALWQAASSACGMSRDCAMSEFNREELVPGIVHFSAIVQIGTGEYDRIGIHRVATVNRQGYPISTKKNLFMLHGDGVPFDKFLFGARSPSTPDEHAAAVFLAQNRVDVWGIDQAWTLVPSETTDFSFMADWGMQHDIDTLRIGLAIARETRRLTGSGPGKMNLLGYSSGGVTGYAYLNEEASLPGSFRQVDGFVVADVDYKVSDPYDQAYWCDTADFYGSLLADGVYQDEFGGLFLLLSDLARNDPDGPSPIEGFEGLTNLQVALLIGAATGGAPVWYHFVAGQFDESGLVTDLTATRVDAWLDFMAFAVPYEPIRYVFDYSTIFCDMVDVPWDDYLDRIKVPLLYLGAAGGVGEAGFYSTTLVRSNDVTLYLGRLTPEVDVFLEFGHIDLWSADIEPNNARTVAWEPLLDWIKDHTNGD